MHGDLLADLDGKHADRRPCEVRLHVVVVALQVAIQQVGRRNAGLGAMRQQMRPSHGSGRRHRQPAAAASGLEVLPGGQALARSRVAGIDAERLEHDAVVVPPRQRPGHDAITPACDQRSAPQRVRGPRHEVGKVFVDPFEPGTRARKGTTQTRPSAPRASWIRCQPPSMVVDGAGPSHRWSPEACHSVVAEADQERPTGDVDLRLGADHELKLPAGSGRIRRGRARGGHRCA